MDLDNALAKSHTYYQAALANAWQNVCLSQSHYQNDE
jgi:hypothetical protein